MSTLHTLASGKSVSLGWKQPSLPSRGKLFASMFGGTIRVPPEVSLRPLCPPVRDQKQLGSCTGQAYAAAIDILIAKMIKDGIWNLPGFKASALWIYLRERMMEGSVPFDDGATCTDGARVLEDVGVASEADWPYNPSKFAVMPPQSVVDAASHVRGINTDSLAHDLNTITGCLALGLPVVVGVAVYDSFFDAPNGEVPIPGNNETRRGGHAVTLMEHSFSKRTLTAIGSWGEDEADQGYHHFPFGYITDPGLCGEIVVVRAVRHA